MNPIIAAAAYLLLSSSNDATMTGVAQRATIDCPAPHDLHPNPNNPRPGHISVRWRDGYHPPRHTRHWHRHHRPAFEDER